LKPERWVSLLVQEEYQGEDTVTRENSIIILITRQAMDM
jgi:hypothetical protein